MEQPRRTDFSAEEFIAWALEQPAGRFELSNGIVIAMAPERVSHGIAKRNILISLHNAIGLHGVECQALPDGISVKVDEQTVYEPDAIVRCGPPLPGDTVKISDPIIVVEIVSPSSRGIDRGVKLASYLSLPSVRHYLIIDTDKRLVIHNHRSQDGRIEVRILHDGELTLDPPGLTIEIQDTFAGL